MNNEFVWPESQTHDKQAENCWHYVASNPPLNLCPRSLVSYILIANTFRLLFLFAANNLRPIFITFTTLQKMLLPILHTLYRLHLHCTCKNLQVGEQHTCKIELVWSHHHQGRGMGLQRTTNIHCCQVLL